MYLNNGYKIHVDIMTGVKLLSIQVASMAIISGQFANLVEGEGMQVKVVNCVEGCRYFSQLQA